MIGHQSQSETLSQSEEQGVNHCEGWGQGFFVTVAYSVTLLGSPHLLTQPDCGHVF